MIASFNISHECYNCLSDRDAVTKALHKKLTKYDRRAVKRSLGQLDKEGYEMGVQQVVRNVLQDSDPKIAHLVDTHVVWSISPNQMDTSIHIHLSNAYMHSLYVQNYSSTVH